MTKINSIKEKKIKEKFKINVKKCVSQQATKKGAQEIKKIE